MAKSKRDTREERRERKPVGWLHGEIKTPPFTEEGRKEAGDLLRLLQEGEKLGMPQAEPLPIVGPRCGALRVRDREHNWRIVYRVDPDAVLVLEVYAKKTRKIPQEVIARCKKRLRDYENTVEQAAEKTAKGQPKKGEN
ncbi:MAG TPA: type II toxin-antitoxin system RelE/ParE family toxin [Gemmataceae bacterium]|jgi:phage-related protein